MLDQDVEAQLSELVDRYVRPDIANVPNQNGRGNTAVIGSNNSVTIHVHYHGVAPDPEHCPCLR